MSCDDELMGDCAEVAESRLSGGQRLPASVKASLLRQVLERNGSAKAIAISSSMAPVLWRGDEVTVSRVADVSSLRVGDVVMVETPDALITHRLLAVADGSLIMKGDANMLQDEPVSCEMLMGRISRTDRKSGRVLCFDAPLARRVAALAAWVSLSAANDEQAARNGSSRMLKAKAKLRRGVLRCVLYVLRACCAK